MTGSLFKLRLTPSICCFSGYIEINFFLGNRHNRFGVFSLFYKKDIFLIRFSLAKAACFICLYNLSRLLVCLLIHNVYLKFLKEVINLSKL